MHHDTSLIVDRRVKFYSFRSGLAAGRMDLFLSSCPWCLLSGGLNSCSHPLGANSCEQRIVNDPHVLFNVSMCQRVNVSRVSA